MYEILLRQLENTRHRMVKVLLIALSLTCLLFVLTNQVASAQTPIAGDEASEETRPVDPFYGSYHAAVPIIVPPFHGIEPNLSIQYFSSGGNGFVGRGWSLSGFSIIERASPGKGAPRYEDSDVFLLDGMELVPCGEESVSPSCFTGGTHSTKIESYMRIELTPSASDQVGEWTVWQGDGTKLIYRPVHVIQTSGGVEYAYQWGLSSVVDTHGNTVRYIWSEANENQRSPAYPDRITYNRVVIRLYRERRSDWVYSANGSWLSAMRYRLKAIDVSVGGQRARAYAIQYVEHTVLDVSILETVTQYGRDVVILPSPPTPWPPTPVSSWTIRGRTLPPTRVLSWTQSSDGTFGAPVYDAIKPWEPPQPNVQRPVFAGDFNGDGKTDLTLSRMSHDDSLQGWLLETVLSNGDGTFGPLIPPNAPGFDQYDKDWKVLIGDFSGNGRDDLCAVYTHESGWRTNCRLSSESGEFRPVVTELHPPEQFFDPGAYVFAADFNGDGKADIALSYANQFGWHTLTVLSKGDGTFSIPVGVMHSTDPFRAEDWKIIAGDFNGDGMADLAASSANWEDGWYVYTVLSNGFGTFSEPITGTQPLTDALRSTFQVPDEFFVGDFNGDGKSDLAGIPSNNTTTWYITTLLSKGNGHFDSVKLAYSAGFRGLTIPGLPLLTGDFNGDGLTDLVRTWIKYGSVDGAGHIEIITALSNGKGRFTFTATNWPSYRLPIFNAADFNGDGKTDLAASTTTNGWHTDTLLAAGEQWYLVTAFQSSVGGIHRVSYAPSSYWTNDNNPPIVPTVASTTLEDGRGISVRTTYEYSGGLYDRWERRFLGFRYVKRTLPRTPGENFGPVEEIWYKQDYGSLSKPEERRYSNGDGELLTLTSYTYLTNTVAPYQSLNYAQRDSIFDGSLWKQTVVARRFDNCILRRDTEQDSVYCEWVRGYGNVTTEERFGDVEFSGDEITEYTRYHPNAGAYIVNRPAAVDIYQGIGVTDELLGRTLLYYDQEPVETTWDRWKASPAWNRSPRRGDVTTMCRWLDRDTARSAPINKFICDHTGYDRWGNVTGRTDATGARIVYVIDPIYHIYMESVMIRDRKSDIIHNTTATWDSVLAVQTETTDVNGSLTSMQYDVFGRLVRIDGPEGWFEKRRYVNLGNPQSQYILTETPPADGSGNLWERQYIDGLGRTWQTVKKGPRPFQAIFQRWSFTVRGQVETRTQPYYARTYQLPDDGLRPAQAPPETTLSYDALNRLERIQYPDGSDTSINYGLLTREVIDEIGHAQTDHLDVFGRIIAHEEQHQTDTGEMQSLKTTYGYTTLGLLETITDPTGENVWTYTYNSLGQMLQEDDPNRGRWTYQYDAAGRLYLVTDARRQMTLYRYDDLDRRTVKITRFGTANEIKSTWTYDESRPGFFNKGRLTTVQDTSGTTHYNYDRAGRLVQGVRTFPDGTTYKFTKNYDAGGRLTGTVFPDGDNISPLEYDSAGRLRVIPGVVRNVVYNARGQVTQLVNANGTVTVRNYDPERGWLTKIRTTHTLSNIAIQDLDYSERDLEGKLLEVISPLPGAYRHYEYDDLDRLTFATIGSQTQRLRYDAIGNIEFNSRLGVYQYKSTKPHAVTQAGPTSYGYDRNGNVTSIIGEAGSTGVGYDGDNRISSINDTTFNYDADGNLAIESKGEIATYYVGDDYQVAVGAAPSRATKYITLAGMLVAKRVGLETFWLHTDHQGSIEAITDADSEIVWSRNYWPYGEPIVDSSSTGSPGELPTLPHIEQRGYTGQHHNQAGLIYLHARIFDPVLARFISPDPVIPTIRNVGLNAYAYSQNDPINRTDIDGLGFRAFMAGFRAFMAETFRDALRDFANAPFIGDAIAINFAANPAYAIVTGDWETSLKAAVAGGFTGGGVRGIPFDVVFGIATPILETAGPTFDFSSDRATDIATWIGTIADPEVGLSRLGYYSISGQYPTAAPNNPNVFGKQTPDPSVSFREGGKFSTFMNENVYGMAGTSLVHDIWLDRLGWEGGGAPGSLLTMLPSQYMASRGATDPASILYEENTPPARLINQRPWLMANSHTRTATNVSNVGLLSNASGQSFGTVAPPTDLEAAYRLRWR